MKRILLLIVAMMFMIPCHSFALTSTIPLTHKTLYGTWKKVVGSGPTDPLYVSFQRNYGLPDEQGTYFDSAKIVVMEPPKEHANYESLLDFMTPKAFSGDKNLFMENDPLTFYEITLGGAKGKAIRGTGRLIYRDNIYPPTNMLAKGYFFTTEKGIIEVLVQIRSAKGDIEKIEQDVDDLVNSIRFGLPEDNLLIKYLKSNQANQEAMKPKPSDKVKLPIGMVLGGAGLLSLLLVFLTRKLWVKKNSKKR